jgi:hypothetical protein
VNTAFIRASVKLRLVHTLEQSQVDFPFASRVEQADDSAHDTFLILLLPSPRSRERKIPVA